MKKERDTEAGARLLRVLRDVLSDREFDQMTIFYKAEEHPELLNALGFLGVRLTKRGRLHLNGKDAIKRWLDWVEDRELAGLYIERGDYGWCYLREWGKRRNDVAA